MLPTANGVDCSEGNTVEARDSCGVVRVLAKDPIRSIDLPGAGRDQMEEVARILRDLENEHFSAYTLDGNSIVNEDQA